MDNLMSQLSDINLSKQKSQNQMVAMLQEINRGPGNSYFNLENSWRTLLRGDPPPVIDVEITPHYQGTDVVPDGIFVDHSIDGTWQDQEFFDNVSK